MAVHLSRKTLCQDKKGTTKDYNVFSGNSVMFSYRESMTLTDKQDDQQECFVPNRGNVLLWLESPGGIG